jgi:hypothetical protein
MARVLLTQEHVPVAVETCLPRRFIAMDNLPGPAIPALSHHVTVLSVHAANHCKASLIHITETNEMDNT